MTGDDCQRRYEQKNRLDMENLDSNKDSGRSLADIDNNYWYGRCKADFMVDIAGPGISPAQFADILAGEQPGNDKSPRNRAEKVGNYDSSNTAEYQL